MEMEMESSPSRPLELFFIPFFSPGHMIPLCEMARLFAVAGHRVTVITTPSNAALIHKTTTTTISSGGDISVHAIPFPAKEVGLPSGLENFFDAKDFNTATRLHAGMTLLSRDMEKFIAARRPDCVVSDMFHPWTAAASGRLRIPRLVFHATCIFAMCLKDAVRSPDSPHLRVDSDYEPFVITGLPDPITMTRSQLPDYVRTPNGYTQMMEEWREAEMKSYGVLVNNFYELDSAYTEHYKKIMGHKIFHVGPTAMIHQNNGEKVERGQKTVVGEHECLSFLDSKKPNSVLYICFGSACIFPNDQLMEIACGVEASTHQFIWVVFGKDNEESAEEKEEWLPKGFEERTKERGMIVKGWAPQVLILDHPSIGGFLTHCGWNSVIEGVSAGVPMATWPLYAEHFYNEKLVTQVLGIGVEVGKMDWNLWVDAGKEVVKRENVERAVRKLMDSGDPAAGTRRQKAKELGEKARRAVQEGGSSHRDLTLLIEELKQLRDEREKLLGAAEALSYSAPT
ncbi:Scopoletin glucosyltransferase [Actinidia chinensis var. chinensis]|uniref:Glycosyltransferase n=1 Tax=Actinidia chinensis var. chinensis TaxID=1590841 RepID=A0A2R6Q8B6_ACTCC|nr:Scopoletin glucosyltransferase [Actinidia chinensis var. chinensis]